MVDASQRRDVADQLVEERRLQEVGLLRNERLVGEHHLLGGCGVSTQQTPVNKPAVAQIGVVGVLGSQTQHVLNQGLGVRRTLEEELHDRGQQLQLDLGILVGEALEEAIQKLVGVINALSIFTYQTNKTRQKLVPEVAAVNLTLALTYNPHHARPRLRFIQSIQILAQRTNNTLILIRILPEYVLDHHDRLLHHVVHFRLDQIQERRDAPLRRRLHLDGAPPDGPHRLAHEVHVHLRRVLLQLAEDLRDVGLRRQPDHDVQLLEFDVDRVVVLDEEHLHFVLEDVGLLLDDEVDVAQGHVLDLGLGGEEGDEGRGEFLAEGAAELGVAGEDLHHLHEDFDGREDDGGVGVGEAGGDALADALGLALVLGVVVGEGVEDEDLAPFGALVEGGEEFVDGGVVEFWKGEKNDQVLLLRPMKKTTNVYSEYLKNGEDPSDVLK